MREHGIGQCAQWALRWKSWIRSWTLRVNGMNGKIWIFVSQFIAIYPNRGERERGLRILLIDRFRISITIDRAPSARRIFIQKNKQTFGLNSGENGNDSNEFMCNEQRQQFIQCLTIAIWSPFLPATRICILLSVCVCVCVFDTGNRVFVHALDAVWNSITSSLPRNQPAATIFGNFYVNRITHPTSTLKIHKYFSAVNRSERETTATTHAQRRTHNGWNGNRKTTHFNDNAMRNDAACGSGRGTKGMPRVCILLQWKWMHLKWKQIKEKT